MTSNLKMSAPQGWRFTVEGADLQRTEVKYQPSQIKDLLDVNDRAMLGIPEMCALLSS